MSIFEYNGPLWEDDGWGPGIVDSDIERMFELDLFRGLTAKQRTTIYSSFRTIHLKQGDILFDQGSAAKAFYFVLRGWVTVSRLSKNGARTVLHVFGANESFAEVAAMAIGDYPAAADAATDAVVVSIPAAAYRALIEEDAAFAMRVIGSLAQRMRLLINEFESSQHASASTRLAVFLLDLHHKQGTDLLNYKLPFSKQVLAARLHMQPESLSRAFSELRALGVESSRDGIISITAAASLQKFIDQADNPD